MLKRPGFTLVELLVVIAIIKAGLSPMTEYIFRKQLEEADLVLVNRMDELPASEVDTPIQLLAAEFPTRPHCGFRPRVHQAWRPECAPIVG